MAWVGARKNRAHRGGASTLAARYDLAVRASTSARGAKHERDEDRGAELYKEWQKVRERVCVK